MLTRRKHLPLLLNLTLIWVFLLGNTGCAVSQVGVESTPTPSDEITISFSASSGQYDFETIMKSFHEKYPSITIQYVPLSNSMDGQELASSADTVLFGGVLPAGGYFRDIQPLLENDTQFEPKDYWHNLLNACQDQNGVTTGLPLSIYSLKGIFYDRQALATAGLLEPQAGWTWEEFKHDVEILAQYTQKGGAVAFLDANNHYSSILAPLIDAVLVEADAKMSADALASELEWYVSKAQEKTIVPMRDVPATEDKEQLTALFAKQRPALWVDDVDHLASGKLRETGLTFTANEVGFVPYPVSTGTSPAPSTPVYVYCAGISAGSSYPHEAWLWLSYLSRQTPLNSGLLQTIPVRQSLAESGGFWASVPKSDQASVRYGLEHAWFGASYPETSEVVSVTLVKALKGETDLRSALQADQPVAESTDAVVKITPISVATPIPTFQSSADRVDIQYFIDQYTLDKEELQALTKLVETFNKEHADVIVHLYTDPEIITPVQSMDNAAIKYDCLSWENSVYDTNEWNKGLLSLTPYFEKEGSSLMQDYPEEVLDLYRVEEEIYGLPAERIPGVMAYNKSLLTQRGLQAPSNDWTMAEFIEMISAVSSPTNQNPPIYGYLYPIYDDSFFKFRGVNWLDLEANPPQTRWDTAQVESGVEWINSLVKSRALFVLDFSFEGLEDDDILTLMENGQIAFWESTADHPVSLNSVMADNDVNFEVGVAPLPLSDKSGVFSGGSDERGYFISSKTHYADACWEWIRYLTEQPTLFKGVPARLSVAASSAWQDYIGKSKAEVVLTSLSRINPVSDLSSSNFLIWPYTKWWWITLLDIFGGSDTKITLKEAQHKADLYRACLSAYDLTKLDKEGLINTADKCARQVDPSWK